MPQLVSVEEITFSKYKFYDVHKGDMGKVSIDGVDIVCIACCPLGGWVHCHSKETGEPVKLGERSEIDDKGNSIRMDYFTGVVEFIPLGSEEVICNPTKS